MKVKELIAKYPGYMVIEKGYPDSIPFSELPRELDGLRGKAYEKVEGELRVYGYSVSHKEQCESKEYDSYFQKENS